MTDLTGLPSMEFSFNLEAKGSETGKSWKGNFSFKRLNYRQKLDASKYAAQLNGDLATLPPNIKFTNDVLALLKFGLIEYPKWWEESNFGLELYDDNIIAELFNKVDEFEQKWRKEIETLNKDPNATVKAK